MKNYCVFLIVLLFTFSACKNCEENIEFKNFYYSKLNEIIDYEIKSSTSGACFSDSVWLHFYETTEYLSDLTDYRFKYKSGEPPCYISKVDFNDDIEFLTNWYKKNVCTMTVEKADSIVAQKRMSRSNY